RVRTCAARGARIAPPADKGAAFHAAYPALPPQAALPYGSVGRPFVPDERPAPFPFGSCQAHQPHPAPPGFVPRFARLCPDPHAASSLPAPRAATGRPCSAFGPVFSGCAAAFPGLLPPIRREAESVASCSP